MTTEDELFKSYKSKLTNRFHKILPLFEEGDEGLHIYISSLIFELNGLPYAVKGVLDDNYVLLIATLESLYEESLLMLDDEKTHSIVRREVFRCQNLIDRIGKESAESSDS